MRTPDPSIEICPPLPVPWEESDVICVSEMSTSPWDAIAIGLELEDKSKAPVEIRAEPVPADIETPVAPLIVIPPAGPAPLEEGVLIAASEIDTLAAVEVMPMLAKVALVEPLTLLDMLAPSLIDTEPPAVRLMGPASPDWVD